jgi:hypothetical protein
MRRSLTLNLHHHSKGAASQSAGARRRRRRRGLHQTIHPLFFTAIIREAIMLPNVGTLKHAHIVERQAIVKKLARISKPPATSHIYFKELREELSNPTKNL